MQLMPQGVHRCCRWGSLVDLFHLAGRHGNKCQVRDEIESVTPNICHAQFLEAFQSDVCPDQAQRFFLQLRNSEAYGQCRRPSRPDPDLIQI